MKTERGTGVEHPLAGGRKGTSSLSCCSGGFAGRGGGGGGSVLAEERECERGREGEGDALIVNGGYCWSGSFVGLLLWEEVILGGVYYWLRFYHICS